MKTINDPEFIPENQPINSLVFMFHGYGADGQDLISIAPFLSQSLPHTAFFAPNGIDPCEVSPLGRQWFSLEKSDPDFLRRSPETMASAFANMYKEACDAAPILEQYIQSKMEEYNVPADKVVLFGFSQGTMMSLHVGLRHTPAFAGIVGCSGALVGAQHLENDIKARPQTLLIHGDADDMLPIHAVDLAGTALEKVNVPHNIIRRPRLPHSIDKTGAEKAAEFMKSLLV